MKQLKLIASPQKESWEDYVDRLTKLGIKAWGYGQSSVVFRHPTLPNVVVKVFVDDDLGYSYYLKWVTKNQHNPYVPKLKEDPKYSQRRNSEFAPKSTSMIGNYSIVFLEHLERSDPADRYDFLQKITPWLAAAGYDRKEKGGFKALSHIGIRGWRILTTAPDLNIAKLARCFVRGEAKTFFLDLSNSLNIMQRGRQLVFTDPFLPGTK